MKTLFNRNTAIAAFAAVVIVGLTGLTLDRGHEGALPKGVIEVGNPDDARRRRHPGRARCPPSK